MKIKINIQRPYGNIEIEGESLDEIVEHLKSMPEWLDMIDTAIRSPEISTSRVALTGLVEYTKDGPQLAVPRERLTDKESITLLLYASDPNPVEYRQLAKLLSLSGRLSAGYPARLSELRSEGYVVKEGESYRLTASGRRFVEELVAKLRGS